MSYEEKYDASLDLLRRLNPKNVEKNLNDICTLIQNDDSVSEELTQDLLSSVDVPLSVGHDGKSKQFLKCDYNRDGDSHRSPWTNEYVPKLEAEEALSAPYPSNTLRELEIKANESFDIYRDLYYEGSGVSSVYLWDTAEEEDVDPLTNGFAGVVLFKKETSDASGKWDSIHVFEVINESSSTALYKLTTSVILDLQNKSPSLSLSGNITRQLESSNSLKLDGAANLETAHLINIGTIVEKAENNIRNLLQEVYFDKLKDIIIKDLRTLSDSSDRNKEDQRQADLIKGLQR